MERDSCPQRRKAATVADTLHVSASFAALSERTSQLIDAGRTAAARPLLAAARALALASADLDLLEARLAVAEDAWAEAILTLDKGLDSAPSHTGLRKCRASLRHRMGDRQGATMDAAEAVVADPADPDAKAILGRLMLDLGRNADAIACLTEAIGICPTNLNYRESLAVALENSGDADAALQVLMDATALRPSSVSPRNGAILLCVRRRDFAEAVRLADKAGSAGVADASTFGMKGHALSSLGREDEAAAAYRAAFNLAPEDPHVHHLVVSHGALPDRGRAPAGYIRVVFDGYADRFEMHLAALGYGLPAAIRSLLLGPNLAGRIPFGPVLELGCGTGLVASALADLAIGRMTGIDLSPQMLRHARAKRLYCELREADIVCELRTNRQTWPLMIAADVLCYFGALDQVLALVSERLQPGGCFIFSVETTCPDRDGTLPGNGQWALQRQGRYSHSENYVSEVLRATGLRVLQTERVTIRQEAGAAVLGVLLVVERMIDDD